MSLPVPYLITEAFGTSAPTGYITLPIPVPDQTGTTPNQASFATGFPVATMTPEASGGLPPFGQDFNGILWMITAYIANFAAGNFGAYNSAQASAIGGYPPGAILANASNNGFWINTSGAVNSTNPDALGAGWQPLATADGNTVAITGGTVTLSAAQAATPYLQFTGALSSNATVVLPTWSGSDWIISNATSGGYSLTVKTASGSGVTVPATGSAAPTSVFCDGYNIQNTGVSTAGLAPINSPSFTGTPNGPTAATSSTTTQLATCAFVKNAITAALSGYAQLASPVFTGTPGAPTAAGGTNNGQIATTAFVQSAITSAISGLAPLASPSLTGNPTAPTQAAGNNSISIATTAFVQAAISASQTRRAGSFTSSSGTAVTVTFSSPIPGGTSSNVSVQVTPNYASPDVGWVVPGSISANGFQFLIGNSGRCTYMADIFR
jgi:hypothetical protein